MLFITSQNRFRVLEIIWISKNFHKKWKIIILLRKWQQFSNRKINWKPCPLGTSVPLQKLFY